MINQTVKIDWPQAKDLPSPGEFASLNRLIASKYPALAATNQREYDQFWSAFQYIFFARRAEQPNTKVSNDTWLQQANDWLLASGQGLTPTTARALVAAAICHGVKFSEPPYPALALAHGTRSETQPTLWRKVLEACRLPDGLPARPLDRGIGMSIRSSAG